jgi:PKHD-type hydroxylase
LNKIDFWLLSSLEFVKIPKDYAMSDLKNKNSNLSKSEITERDMSGCGHTMTNKNTMSFWPFNADNLERWAFWEGGFTNEECDEIIQLGLSYDLKKGVITDGLDLEYRESNIKFLWPDACPIVFQKLSIIVNDLNSKYFNFDLWGFAEGLQFTEYKSPSGHYNWHTDMTYKGYVRKLSVVLQLSEPDDFGGGFLELSDQMNDSKYNVQLKKSKGTVYVFPSYINHRVSQVTTGTRYSLVGWVTGPAFR